MPLYQRLQIMALLPAVYLHSLSHDKWLTCSLSPVQSSYTHIWFIPFSHSDFTSWSIAERFILFTKLTTLPWHARFQTSQPIALLIYNYVSSLERLLPLQVLPSLSIVLKLTPSSWPITRISPCILSSLANFKIRHALVASYLYWRLDSIHDNALTFNTNVTTIKLASHKQPDYCSSK